MASEKRPIVIARKKKTPIKSAIAGLILVGGYLIYKAVTDFVQVRTPVQFSKAKLTSGQVPVPISSYPYFEWITIKLPIKELAIQMGNAMTGITTEATMLKHYKNIINVYTYNDVRGLHNMFLKYVDPSESLYDWIGSELATGSTEEKLRDQALKKLDLAGVGKTNVIKIPTQDMLKI